MPTPVLMPTFGLTQGEATITRWLKSVGEPVDAFEPLFEAEMDKAIVEVPAPKSGVLLRIMVEEGDTAPLTAQVGWIGNADETVPDLEPAHGTSRPLARASDAQTQAPSVASSPSAPLREQVPSVQPEQPIRATPLARRLARELGVDLANLQGTGPRGRIVEADVRLALRQAGAEGATVGGPQPSDTATLTQAASPMARQDTGMRAFSACHYLRLEVNCQRLVELRENLLSFIRKGFDSRLSATVLFARAIALALLRHPRLHKASLETQAGTSAEVRMSLAIATSGRLVKLVIRGAEAMRLGELAQTIQDLVSQAEEASPCTTGMENGAFGFIDLGRYEVDEFFPALQPQQTAVLAAGAIARRPVDEHGEVVLRPTVRLTLTADCHIVDEAEAALFMRDLGHILERPASMLV